MTIKYHYDIIQGSEEWAALRCGLLTASEMKLILTPTLKLAQNEKQRAHIWELLAQRITRYVEPSYISDDMLRGRADEIEARILYAERYAPVTECGFITNDKWGFTIGYSPDGLVGDDGLIEAKSRRQKYQAETIVSCLLPDGRGDVPADFMLQVQTGLLVSERKWTDFVSYSGGMPMATIRAYPDPKVCAAIEEAATRFEDAIAGYRGEYEELLASKARLIPTERRVEQEMVV